jgi:copper resistance protein C
VRTHRTLTLLVLTVLCSASLFAHLKVVKTAPADKSTVREAPTSVQVWFTQQPSRRVSRLEMSGPAGEVMLGDSRIDSQDRSISATVPETVGPGKYEVTWRTAGDDGHVQRGTFTFVVGGSE